MTYKLTPAQMAYIADQVDECIPLFEVAEPHPDVDAGETLATVSGDLMVTRKDLRDARATIKLLVAALVAVGIINGVVMASIIWGR